ncbi:hypothetical protein MPTK1_8g13280 [Marchantia polymorpha subsp. ruderalis]|uniref:Uncharacterized protein n=1 Tax=Marchantia polymorpha TaxID=3197 RepID=A0A2R6WCD5_MARPO|nr:hypothetical protein MARPO_0110s0009 [Marchantia polymorpha]PTQ31516.1 hypothetical protein MARPO_0110s0009 [Marchantia polymorpha]BBN19748.1 hypothetical protein Mp_8g13280 [Marchantia polymorpha subsp. ruderalis]BBN19749.1 hypothetical protein Mp_8g13280 [Marchantia polymorpha subsp. ruderalis]|eukprot:PTQ31515.1 hypothetical protein MARPO_0110s0009 [Marchantia polymorpha]
MRELTTLALLTRALNNGAFAFAFPFTSSSTPFDSSSSRFRFCVSPFTASLAVYCKLVRAISTYHVPEAGSITAHRWAKLDQAVAALRGCFMFTLAIASQPTSTCISAQPAPREVHNFQGFRFYYK